MADVKCRFCKAVIKDKENCFKVGKASYYCDEYCYNQAEERRKEQKNKYKPRENTDRRELTDYILEIYTKKGYDKSEIQWNMIMSQVKSYEKDYGYKLSGIRYCLWYMIEIEEMNLFKEDDENFNGSILNLVPFYYEKSKKYCINKMNIKKVAEEYKNCDSNVVLIKRKNVRNKKDLINIEDLI